MYSSDRYNSCLPPVRHAGCHSDCPYYQADIAARSAAKEEKRILRYCPELAPVIQNRPMYNKWRAHIHLPSKAPRAPFHDQMEFDFR